MRTAPRGCTGPCEETRRIGCFVVSDILLALTTEPDDLSERLLSRRLASLEDLVINRRWSPVTS
ncbi:hypothetical protein ASE25_01590 [Terrabacter sp. Root85]|nr:hypothetical protein ASE25_01590 [Terrabacter sp. Root85]KRF48777.1 hypothetical protein ASH01_03660 [Terrabacter sp. Soil811]